MGFNSGFKGLICKQRYFMSHTCKRAKSFLCFYFYSKTNANLFDIYLILYVQS